MITLGIIGVVAALTMPSLIQAHKRVEVAAKLKQIYSLMNQAILMSEKDNGNKEYWDYSSGIEQFFLTYILPYIKYTKYELFESAGGTNIAVYFANGSIMVAKKGGGIDCFYIPNGKNLNTDTFSDKDDNGNFTRTRKGMGSFIFAFGLYSHVENDNTKFLYNQGGFEPYKYRLNTLNEDELKHGYYGCYTSDSPSYCTALIQYNGWTFPKDYPYKVK